MKTLTHPHARILNPRQIHELFDHILDGFKATNEGIEFVHSEGVVDDAEYRELLQKNAARLIARIRQFKLANNIVSLFFAVVFSWCQVNGNDLEMRRSARGRRRNETELSHICFSNSIWSINSLFFCTHLPTLRLHNTM